MAPPYQLEPSNEEGRIILANQAIKLCHFQSVRAVTTAYDIPRSTYRDRARGIPSRRDCTPNSRKLTPIEELAIVQYILDLDSRGFPPRPQGVREMADLLLAKRNAPPVGKN
jgi:hypothetical protein